jgi:hypothetical protein
MSSKKLKYFITQYKKRSKKLPRYKLSHSKKNRKQKLKPKIKKRNNMKLNRKNKRKRKLKSKKIMKSFISLDKFNDPELKDINLFEDIVYPVELFTIDKK